MDFYIKILRARFYKVESKENYTAKKQKNCVRQ